MNRKLLTTAVCGVLAVPFAALAQDAQSATDIDKVVVTGSLIPQVQIETATPIQSITAEDMQRQGFRDVYDVLRSQPLATGAVQDAQFSGGFTPGAEPISLLGLDPGFTLVLIDGRPMADYPLLYNGQSNFVDLSSIPTAMVERIDIAPGNQSAVYGSSAIAGVVNIILKKRMDGSQLNLRIGAYDQGGGANTRFQFTTGREFGDLSLVFGLQYSEQDPIYGFDRDQIDSTNDNPDPDLRYGSRTFLRSLADGTYVSPDPSTCAPLSRLFGGSTIYDERPGRGFYCGSREEVGYTTIMNKEQSIAGYLNAVYTLNDNAELYGTLLVNRDKSESNSGSRFWQPSTDTGGFIVNADSGEFESFQHIFAPEETGDLDYNNERLTSDSYNFAAGIRGNFGASAWGYDAYYARSQFKIKSRQNWLLAQNVEDFFRESFLGPQLGEYYGYPIYSPDVAAFYRPVTPDEYRSFNSEIRTDSETWTHNLNLQLTNTELFELPAGPVGFAAVLQAGEQKWENPTDPRVVNGEFWGLTGTQGEGKRTNQAVAVEFRVPIFSMLTANLSGRYDQYKNEGLNEDNDTTYKIGLEFRPIESLLLRANYATAFKAPDMAYVFAGDSGFFTTVRDYYRCAVEEPGVPVSDCSFDAEQVFGTRRGAPDLESITAESWGGGVVWSPTPNFSVNADYYHIKIDNKVSDLNLDQLMQEESACRLGQLDPGSPTCVNALARIGRSAPTAPVPNQVETVLTNPINISKEEVSGILADLTYGWQAGSWGDFNLRLSYNVTLDHESQQYPEDPVLDLLSEPFYSSEFRNIGSASLSWNRGPWNANLYGVRYSRTPNYRAQINEAGYAVEGAERVDAMYRFNGTLGYEFTEDVALTFTVNNLLDEDPPEDNTWDVYPYYNNFNYNMYGRSYMLEVNWRFQ
ncbi:TonB-dependent receptor plug domain-containing protein [Lysobacter auxotrophicus]|uniref:TonB-dependent receptor n=1 Tax=Lysobacter auxotrophicus TaxID=2992573 RepID=A0ABM8D8R1_9GAMM|nr:TonB-dependent receptor [Lysobacter auxotrophicus]BDU14940.1 TonB-dependent receptor [Lysobacter auxotrophicus]